MKFSKYIFRKLNDRCRESLKFKHVVKPDHFNCVPGAIFYFIHGA